MSYEVPKRKGFSDTGISFNIGEKYALQGQVDLGVFPAALGLICLTSVPQRTEVR